MLLFFPLLAVLLLSGCAKPPVAKIMETTAYCGCSSCCSWERGSWRLLKLDFWNRYVSSGPNAGRPYSGLTASGTRPLRTRGGTVLHGLRLSSLDDSGSSYPVSLVSASRMTVPLPQTPNITLLVPACMFRAMAMVLSKTEGGQ